MTEQGKVVELKEKDAVVRIFRSSACGHCEMCGLTSDKKFIDIEVPNSLDAKQGDSVEIEIEGNSAVKVSLIVYMIPLAIALILTVGGYLLKLQDWALVLIFIGGLGLGFGVVRYIDKRFSKKMGIIPVMTKILQTEDKQ